MLLPAALIHPFTVCVTVYVPPVVTVIDAVVAPLLHNNDPVNPDAVNTELPQLLTTDTAGAAGLDNGAATPLPEHLYNHSLFVLQYKFPLCYCNRWSGSTIAP